MQRELPRFANGAEENQQRNERGACAEQGEAGAFKTTGPSIVKEQCAAAIVEPKHPEKKSHVANARSNERLFCSGRCTRSLDPEPDEQVGGEPHQLPKNEKEQQTVRDDQPEHRAGEER